MSALEKFKRRLVRDIARRQYEENQPEDEMWDQLKTEYGCDCFLLWQHMKVLTSKKLKRLLAAEDLVERITRVARMTSTDWLTFDLVLVHQEVDVIGEELIQSGKPESQVLELLFNLVIMYSIEDCSGDRLVAKWAALSRAYNSGGRQCSPMLLQRRWHQLKDFSRRRIYEFWKQYRGNSRNLPKAVRPTKLQIRISETLPYLITKRFLQWKDLLESGKIIQAVQIENRRRKVESNVRNDDPDLVVIEPHVETIELGADSEDDEVKLNNEVVIDTEESITAMEIDDNQFEQNTFVNAENSPETIDNSTSDSINNDNNVIIKVKTEPTEVLELNDTLSDDEVIENDNFENIEDKSETEHVENDCKYSENHIVLPKITNVMGNVNIESNAKNSTCHITSNEILSDDDSPNDSDIASSINLGDTNKTFEENVKENPPFNTDDIMDISKLPSTIEFVDDGIEFVDDDEDNLEGKVDTDDGNKIVNLDDVDPSYDIDSKLVMIPITYTKKLEDMNVLKNISYSTVKGNQLIKLIESESKIITLSEEIKTDVKTDNGQTEKTAIENDSDVTIVIRDDDESRSQDNSQVNNVTNIETSGSKYAAKAEKEDVNPRSEDNSEKCEISRVKYTSWLLQKPKHRNYNPILLCKNPDFNTRLKRLSVGFFLSERNRQLINACKPLTIDMHKSFEAKLVNNILYLEKATTPYINEEKVAEVCENIASVIPSAVPVQSLLDMTRVQQKDLLSQKTQIDDDDESKSSADHKYEDDRVIERGHVINEPIMSIMDCPKEMLIKNEKTSIASTPVSDTRRPAEIIGTALSTLPPPTNKKSKTKPKPPAPAPRWTTYGTAIEYEESLITKDTFNKVLRFLDTGVFQIPKKGCAAPSETTKKPTTKVALPPPPSTNETTAQDKVLKTKSTPDNDELNCNNISQTSKRRRNNPHSITPQSGYCCWARSKIDYLRMEHNNIQYIKAKQYRHLCPMGESGCICCCRQDLLETMVSLKLKLDHTYSRESDPPLPKEPTTIETRDTAIQARLTGKESGQMKSKSTIGLNPQNKNISTNEQGKTAHGEVKISNNSARIPLVGYIVLSGSKQPVNNNDAKQFAHASCSTSDFSLTDNETPHVATAPIIKTNVIPALPHRGNKAEVFSVTADAGRQPTPRSIAVNKNIAQKAVDEIISLVDEEESAPNQTSSSAPKQLLPKGVNILLLPDKTLSVSIEPGVQIDPVNLSKLPEILSAVQSKLLQPGVLNKCTKFPIKKWKYPSGNQTATRNTVDNDPTIVNLDPQKNIVDENPKVNAVDPGLNDIYETVELNTLNTDLNVTEDNAELVVVDPGVQVSRISDELNSMSPEVNVPKESAKVAVPQQNAELIAIDPILPIEKEQAEHNISPELHSSEENAELTILDPNVPVTEENYDLVVNSEIDVADNNAELAVINVNAKNCEINVISNELIDTAENAVNNTNSVVLAPQTSVNVVNVSLNASEEKTCLSNNDTNFTNAETTPKVYVGNLQPTVANIAENVIKDDGDKLTYTDYIVKVKAPDNSRKTILSDLMTMSGISTEDTNTPTEPPAANVINYNLKDDPYYLTNTYNVGGNIQIGPPPKKVKKVMVFIKKRSKVKPVLNESVIDLTADNDNSAETSKQNDPQTDKSPKQGSDSNKILNLKRAKLVRVPAAAVPHKIYQAAQSLLRKDNTFPVKDETTLSPKEIETQMKIHLAKHYRKLNKKPTILDILKNIKHSKEIQASKQSRKQSESSDDEPLAKKSRRMRENTEDNVSVTVLPVGEYNVPVEYNSNVPTMLVPAISDVRAADTEDVDGQEADILDTDTQNVDGQEADILDTDDRETDILDTDDRETDILDTDDRETDFLDADDQGLDSNTDDDEGSILGI